MKLRELFERLLFGQDGLARAEAAEERIQAAIEVRRNTDADLEHARAKLQAAVSECQTRSRKLASDPPPVVRFIVLDELEPDARGSRP